ncbi:MAG: MqnA/MqnD/SBP family protein [Thermoplasmataceae archaeon]
MIGLINFRHSDPLARSLKSGSFIRDHPKAILSQVLDGRLDCGMVSLVSYLENNRELGIMETANIHSLSNTLSTLLISNGGGLYNGMKIAVTSHTRTTEFYLERVLEKLGFSYSQMASSKTTAADLLSEADHALIIGDEAIRVFSGTDRILLDVGYEFSRLYSKPPVYAVSVYRKDRDFPAEDFEVLQDSVRRAPESRKVSVSETVEALGVSTGIVEAYYRYIRYDFNRSVRDTIDYVSRNVLGKS